MAARDKSGQSRPSVEGKHGGTLYPAQPGEVRNPSGKNQYTAMRELGEQIFTEFMLKKPRGARGKTRIALLCEELERQAAKGNSVALKALADRVLPTIEQRHELTGRDGGPVELDSSSPWARLGAELAALDERPQRGNGKANGSGARSNGSGEAPE